MLRIWVLRFIYYSGLMRLWLYWHRDKVTIVAFHNILPTYSSSAFLPLRHCLHEAHFEGFLKIIRRFYRVVSLSEAVDILSAKVPPKRNTLVITFDDGYRNNLTHALPLVEKYGLPMTLYLTSELMTQRKPMWADRLDYAYLNYEGDDLSISLGEKALTLPSAAIADKRARLRQFILEVKSVVCADREFHEKIDALCLSMEKSSGKALSDIFEHDDTTALLNWSDIQESPFLTLGSHTKNHFRLAAVPADVIETELCGSKAEIKAHLGVESDHFAYPDGSFNERVCDQVQAAGYQSAVTVQAGLNEVGCDLYRLKRMFLSTEALEPADLIARLSGVSSLFARVKAYLRDRL